MFDQVQAKVLDRFDRMLSRQRVDSVFHCVRWQDLAVVALGMRCLETPFQLDRQGQLFDIVAAFLPRDAKQPHMRLAVIIFAQPDRHDSAPAIRGISVRTQEQRYVVMLVRAPHLENNAYLRIQRFDFTRNEIGARIKSQSICPFLQRSRCEQRAEPPVAVGHAAAQFFPSAARFFHLKNHGHARSGPPDRDIQHMCGYLAHGARSFSKRSRVILRCSSAATRNSASGSFDIRSCKFFRISPLLFPVAQIKKTCPNFAWYSRFVSARASSSSGCAFCAAADCSPADQRRAAADCFVFACFSPIAGWCRNASSQSSRCNPVHTLSAVSRTYPRSGNGRIASICLAQPLAPQQSSSALRACSCERRLNCSIPAMRFFALSARPIIRSRLTPPSG